VEANKGVVLAEEQYVGLNDALKMVEREEATGWGEYVVQRNDVHQIRRMGRVDYQDFTKLKTQVYTPHGYRWVKRRWEILEFGSRHRPASESESEKGWETEGDGERGGGRWFCAVQASVVSEHIAAAQVVRVVSGWASKLTAGVEGPCLEQVGVRAHSGRGGAMP
jgi:hypothetical protein